MDKSLTDRIIALNQSDRPGKFDAEQATILADVRELQESFQSMLILVDDYILPEWSRTEVIGGQIAKAKAILEKTKGST